MALRSNSKKAVENIRQYIRDGYNPDGYELQEPDTFPALAAQLLQVFRSEKYHLPQDVRYYYGSEQAAFADWCAGLPSILDTCYFYNRSAVALTSSGFSEILLMMLLYILMASSFAAEVLRLVDWIDHN